MLVMVLGAAAIHELGHWLVLRHWGVQTACLRLTVFGAEMISVSAGLSYGKELAAVLAGPLANLLWGLLLAWLGGPWLVPAGANLVLCAFNLLPVRPLDGGRALELLVSWAAGPAAGERAAVTAVKLGVCPDTVYKELKRGYTGELNELSRPAYDPVRGQAEYQRRLRNRGHWRRNKEELHGSEA